MTHHFGIFNGMYYFKDCVCYINLYKKVDRFSLLCVFICGTGEYTCIL